MVVSCEEGNEVVVEEKKGNKEGSSSMVRWERFLPKMAIRVLLVEADDSTRQIIGALLRKCSYKVASAPDGLKAWEVLKARPHNIDLILTEVELPSISGYALLTLIMEHEICKNIPVIMMSKNDSVSTVYKCMLRGASDFLVKPIRINELKNLWQHVWRRQSLNREQLNPQQQTLEATAENNAMSDHSSGSKACAPRQEQCVKKGSDAQSSCGKRDLEAESAHMAEVEDYSQPKQGISSISDLKMLKPSNSVNFGQNLCSPEDIAAYNDNNALDPGGGVKEQNRGDNMDLYTEDSDNRDEAIDLIGAFGNHSRRESCSNDGGNKFEVLPQLDLSLRRCHLGVYENKTNLEKQMLNHSNSSAFTRYVNNNNKTLHTSNSNAPCCSTPTEDRVNSGDHLCDKTPDSNSNARKVISLPTTITKEVENDGSSRLFPVPLGVNGIRVDLSGGYGSVIPPIPPPVFTPSPSPSLTSANQQMNSFHPFSVDRHYHPVDQSPRTSSNQPISNHHDQKMESSEDRAHFSQTADQSASSALCNATTGHLNAALPGCSDSGNERSHVRHQLNNQRSIQREAALNKFRLKRKERCFEKKVRYESRKKLAEQRPRVKGQFVRHVPLDSPPRNADNSGVNSVETESRMPYS